jgi:hypothetical protein
VTHCEGHAEFTAFEVPIDASSYMSPAQKVASALTYTKRYTLMNALGVVTIGDDDDGEGVGVDDEPRPERTPAGHGPVQRPGSGPTLESLRGDMNSVYRSARAWRDNAGAVILDAAGNPVREKPEGVPAIRLFTEAELDAMGNAARESYDNRSALVGMLKAWTQEIASREAAVRGGK